MSMLSKFVKLSKTKSVVSVLAGSAALLLADYSSTGTVKPETVIVALTAIAGAYGFRDAIRKSGQNGGDTGG